MRVYVSSLLMVGLLVSPLCYGTEEVSQILATKKPMPSEEFNRFYGHHQAHTLRGIFARPETGLSKFSQYIHPTKGVRLSLGGQVDLVNDPVFLPDEFDQLLTTHEPKMWQIADKKVRLTLRAFIEYHLAPEGYYDTSPSIKTMPADDPVYANHRYAKLSYYSKCCTYSHIKVVFDRDDDTNAKLVNKYIVGIIHIPAN